MLSFMEAGSVAFFIALLGTPLWRRFLVRHEFGQKIREDGPQHHRAKEGTPTMGGVVTVAAAVLGYLCGHVGPSVPFSKAGVLAIAVTAVAGLLGFVDDFIGIRNARNLGLNKRGKFAGQLAIGVSFATLAVWWVHTKTTLSFTRSTLPGWHLGAFGWIVMAVFILVATSNAVNFSDGLDGLAAGSSTLCFAALGIIGYLETRNLHLYHNAASLDLGMVAIAMVGAGLGFLWWNAAPARIYMGDTGSLAIGTALGAICLLMNLDLLLVVIGGLYVVEASSVVLQILSFRLFHRRIFRMAPIHHHFELRGWPETTIIVRFWILSGLLAAMGLGLFYADFLRIKGL